MNRFDQTQQQTSSPKSDFAAAAERVRQKGYRHIAEKQKELANHAIADKPHALHHINTFLNSINTDYQHHILEQDQKDIEPQALFKRALDLDCLYSGKHIIASGSAKPRTIDGDLYLNNQMTAPLTYADLHKLDGFQALVETAKAANARLTISWGNAKHNEPVAQSQNADNLNRLYISLDLMQPYRDSDLPQPAKTAANEENNTTRIVTPLHHRF